MDGISTRYFEPSRLEAVAPRSAYWRLRVGIALIAALASGGASAAPTAEFDHSHTAFSVLLSRYVKDGHVAYGTWKKQGSDQLNAYLKTLAGVSPQAYGAFSESEKLAFWLNAYNAYTIRLILDHYPVDSIRSIGMLPGAAWRKSFIPIHITSKDDISLNDIEHEIIRKKFSEPRIHMALVCAAKSCPKLRSEAFVGSSLDRQLREQTLDFINDPTKNRLPRDGGKMALSAIFKWFRGDFEAGGQTLNGFVAGYVNDPEKKSTAMQADIEFLDYDWALNGS